MAVFKSRFAGGPRTSGQGGGAHRRILNGVDFHYFSVNLPTAALDSADEQILLWKFPDDSDCWLFRAGSTLDSDDGVLQLGSHFSIAVTDVDGGSSFVWSLGLSDVDGVLDTTIISGSTVGQAAGIDYLDAPAEPLDCTGKYLCMDVTAAATATILAGTATVRMKVAYGTKLEVDTGVA